VKIVVVQPTAGQKLVIDPHTHTTEPTMPTVTLEAKVFVQGVSVVTGTVRWELSISGQYRVRSSGGYREQAYVLPAGSTTSAPEEKKVFQLAPALITGGKLSVTATYTAGPEVGNAHLKQTIQALVVGGPPSDEEIALYIIDVGGDLIWLFLRLFMHESSFRQFQGSDVLYGPPSGVGIGQRDPEAPEWKWPKKLADRVTQPNNFFPMIFWNWKRNIDAGMAFFRNVKLPAGKADLDSLQGDYPSLPAPLPGMVTRAGIRRYNGGTEYVASADGKHYVLDTSRSDYVNVVLGMEPPHAAEYPVPADVQTTVYPSPPAPKKPIKG
jgi:type VI secretion system secreted protein VgrG